MKIIVEDDHSVVQLVNVLQLVVRHFKVYYPVRHHVIQHMVNSLQRLGFTHSGSGDDTSVLMKRDGSVDPPGKVKKA
ncbi:transformation/transcription domain-associated protein-like [Mercenaria mercenaria]|uniref:transformation/transcription domain-associated protein-like n=1 Tax=Mercenaria mercenaria TaxID=6596 RepID=UPI00234EA5B4|nr:transformation/transcription domain-associated protein-like [Mercenaria mercenaria]